ncbi:MAG: hypothetical protein LHV68_02100 [Elusimicrobia bacterium]|nr:hypothetical protein [Candidatus Liberimonas magnetica]
MFQRREHILNKIREYGIRKSIRVFIHQLIYFYKSWKLPWLINRTFYYNLFKLLFLANKDKKRILGVWDLKNLPWSVGDPLIFIEILGILKLENSAEEIDVCVLYDRENPDGKRSGPGSYTNLNTENAQDYILEFFQMFSVCPFLGSIYQFNDREEFYHFLKTNMGRYHIYPPLSEHLAERYDYSDFGIPLLFKIQDFYNLNKSIPYLRIGNRESSWAKWFYLKYLPKSSMPIAISLKNTVHSTERNANPETWLSFIDKCKIKYPEIIFVVVGLREEVFEGLRERKNVLIAKDYGTNIIEDFALIRSSLIYMGTVSGINLIAFFSDLPYLIFQWRDSEVSGIYGFKENENFSFATGNQKIFSTKIKVTPELLFEEFNKLYTTLDRSNWLKETITKAAFKHSHPGTKAVGK